jgi:hypothetical protein
MSIDFGRMLDVLLRRQRCEFPSFSRPRHLGVHRIRLRSGHSPEYLAVTRHMAVLADPHTLAAEEIIPIVELEGLGSFAMPYCSRT